jgi:hypothetical protein
MKFIDIVATNKVMAGFQYDAFHRRIEKVDYAASVTRRYYYDSEQRVLEGYDAAGTPVAQRSYLWGSYVDELLAIDNDPPQADGFEWV